MWGDTNTDAAEPMDRETVFDILSNRRRRYVLHHLRAEGGRTDIRSLSERIAAWENGRAAERVTSKERKRVYTALHQSHLPKMDRTGVVRYDPDRGTVELTESSAEFDVYLDVVPRSELNWGEFYLGLGSLGTLVAALVAFDVFPFTLVPPVAYLFVFGLTALVVGAVHSYQRRRARIGHGERPPDVEAPAATSRVD